MFITRGKSIGIRLAFVIILMMEVVGNLPVLAASSIGFGWAKRIGGTGDNFGVSIVPDGDENLYFAGSFTGTVDFDPNAGTHNLTSAGSYDISVSKLESDGNFIWAFRLGGIADDKGQGLITDGMGAIYVTGGFSDTVDFDPGAGTYTLSADLFISKLDTMEILSGSNTCRAQVSSMDLVLSSM
jgi:hypothetical protein